MKFLTMIAICAGLLCFELGVISMGMFTGLGGMTDLMLVIGFGAIFAWCGFIVGASGTIKEGKDD